MNAAGDLLSVSEDVSGASISGVVAAGFEDVLQVFTDNFRRRGEVGAACAIYRGDEMLVHLWGGYRDQARTERWNDDTLACVHSTTKAITAVAMAMAVSRGHFSLDDTVASHWPEFGVHGKQHITIGQILDHSAGLPAVEETLTIEHLADLDGLSEILARQKPQWEPGTRHGYHGWTFGMYANEIMRRTDPEGRSVGQFVAKEISESLGEEFYIGLPDTVPDHRLSEEFTNLRTLLDMLTNKPVSTMGTMLRFLFEKDTLQAKMLKNPVELVDSTSSTPVPSGAWRSRRGTVTALPGPWRTSWGLAPAAGLRSDSRRRALPSGREGIPGPERMKSKPSWVRESCSRPA